MKQGNSFFEVQTYWTEPENDWVFDTNRKDVYTNPYFLEQCKRRGIEPDNTGWVPQIKQDGTVVRDILDNTESDNDNTEVIENTEENTNESIIEDNDDEEIDISGIFDDDDDDFEEEIIDSEVDLLEKEPINEHILNNKAQKKLTFVKTDAKQPKKLVFKK